MSTDSFAPTTWDEKTVSGTDGAARITHVHATFDYSGTIEGSSICDYLLYYPGADYDSRQTTSPGLERIEATVAGRAGSFVVRHDVGFDPTGIRGTWTVVGGSGTGELAGIFGSGAVEGTIGEPTMGYTFDYAFES